MLNVFLSSLVETIVLCGSLFCMDTLDEPVKR
jgi:hypothetical protein